MGLTAGACNSRGYIRASDSWALTRQAGPCGILGFYEYEPARQTIAGIVSSSQDHTTLLQAVTAAGLVPTLNSASSSLTVFAPTDAAFAALPSGTLSSLLADPSGQLKSILLYHVVQGQVLSSQLSNNMVVTTLNGASIKITIDSNGQVKINDVALVIKADLIASNGVVHVIDAVLLPPSPTTTTTPIPTIAGIVSSS